MATLLSLAGYLFYIVCMVGLSFLVLRILVDYPPFENLPDSIQVGIALITPFLWLCFVPLSFSNLFLTHFFNLMAMLFSLACYLAYIACMMALSGLVIFALSAYPSVINLPDFSRGSIALLLPFALKNFQWVALISESHYTLPSSVSEVIAMLFCLAGYLVCMMIGLLVFNKEFLVWGAALGKHRGNDELSDWKGMIIVGVVFVVTDWITGYYMDPDFISGFLSGSLGFLTYIMATLLSLAGYLVYIVSMVAMSYLVILIADRAIRNTRDWWPELIHTSIVGITLLLLNMLWGSPFEKPSTDSDMKSAFVGIAGYLIYTVCSMALSYHFFGSLLLLKTFTISLTFVMLNMFVRPSSLSEMIATAVGLTGMIATALLALFFLLAMSFAVFMFLHTWAEILLPSARRDYPARMFVSIVILTFMVMKTMLGIRVEEPSIFFDMKAGLAGITDVINEYHGAYIVIRNLTVLAVPLLSMESWRIVSMYHLYTTAAFIVALGLVLTMPPGPGTPTESPASALVTDDFVQQTITSFVTSQIKRMDGEIEQLADS